MGRSGREIVCAQVPVLRDTLSLDAVVVNAENSAAGFGITPTICAELYRCGVDVITTGNHIWDQKEIIFYIDSDPRLLRPLNYPPKTPGRGVNTYSLSNGLRLTVVNVMTRLFMDVLDDPFQALKDMITQHILKRNTDIIVVDVHGEATSEKASIGYFLDGLVSLVVGTHTHVPTADHRLLPRGTAFMSDAGMCGDYNSVVGMDYELAMSRFVTKMPVRLKAAEGQASLCGVIADVSRETGLATAIRPIRVGGCLMETPLSA